MSEIPRARKLLALALLDMPEPWQSNVRAALCLMTRVPPAKPRAPPRKRFMDAEMAARIRAVVAAQPDVNLETLAAAFGTSVGRASEALHGKR